MSFFGFIGTFVFLTLFFEHYDLRINHPMVSFLELFRQFIEYRKNKLMYSIEFLISRNRNNILDRERFTTRSNRIFMATIR